MPQTYPDKSGALPWSNSGNLTTAIVLDQAVNVSYTNLDQISGKVVVRCAKPIDVAVIVVKVEGESRTRLLPPPIDTHERPQKPQLEYHKVCVERVDGGEEVWD
jgi:hypothetical protein